MAGGGIRQLLEWGNMPCFTRFCHASLSLSSGRLLCSGRRLKVNWGISNAMAGRGGRQLLEWGNMPCFTIFAVVHLFLQFYIFFAVVPCILQLCHVFFSCAKIMYYSFVHFCWCANEISVDVGGGVTPKQFWNISGQWSNPSLTWKEWWWVLPTVPHPSLPTPYLLCQILFENKKVRDVGNNCLLSVDGTDFCVPHFFKVERVKKNGCK